MFSSKKKALAMSVLCAIASVGFVISASAAETSDKETMSHNLDEVVVEGDKDVLPGGFVSTKGSVGILGSKDVMDVPYTQTNVTAQNIEDFGGPNQALDNVLVNIPSVRQTGTMLHGDFSVRGKSTNGSFFYVNGVPGMMGQFFVPSFIADSIEVTAGPNKAISGTFPAGEGTGVAAVINMTTKKATNEPVTRYRQIFSGKSGFGEAIDVGRRFGKNNEWGVRVNAEFMNGNPTHYKSDKNSQSFFANIDHQGDNSKTNFLVGYQYYEVEDGMRWFGFDSKSVGKTLTHMPSAPNSKNNYSFPGMDKVHEGTLMVLNHEQKIDEGWKWFFNGGWTRSNLRKNITGQSSKLTIMDDDGTYAGKYFTRRTPSHKYYAQLGLNGEFDTGKVKHDVVFAVDKSWSKSWTGVIGGYSKTNFTGLGGNIFTGVDPNEKVDIPSFENYHNSSSTYWGASLMDTMTLGKAQMLLGVHRHQASSTTYSDPSKGEVITKNVKSDATCPAYGFVYQPDDNVSLYASHSEFFDSGSRVSEEKDSSGLYYENAGQILEPSKAKSNEIGIKYENKGFLATLAFFHNKEANAITSYNSDFSKKWYANDGENEYKGVELSVNGRLSDKWNIMGGLMYMDSKRSKTEKGTYDGYRIGGVPEWTGVAALQYKPDQDWSIIGRAVYVGDTPIFPASNKVEWTVPSYVTYDLGVKYKTKMNNTPVTLNAMCYNLTGKNYWIAYGSGLHLSSPRTFMLSATFDI